MMTKPSICGVWPHDDLLRLACLLPPLAVTALVATCKELMGNLKGVKSISHEELLDAEGVPRLELELQQAIAAAQAAQIPETLSWSDAWTGLGDLEKSLQTELRYIYGPDWEIRPREITSKKGTWIKSTTQFSWELTDGEKLYVPHGIVMPVLQCCTVKDSFELNRHQWGPQHLRIWMKPTLVRTLDARRPLWYLFWPHWSEDGPNANDITITAMQDTWLKRSTQMSKDMAPFELIYVPQGQRLSLGGAPALVDEPWEVNRHPYVHEHRKILVRSPLVTVKRDKHDVLIYQT